MIFGIAPLLSTKEKMPKDCRIVVRMSEDLRDWVHAQAQIGEQDDAAFVRMVLSNMRRGVLATPMIAPAGLVDAPMAPAAITRDVLVVSSDAEPSAQSEVQNPSGITIDVDAMVDASLAEAEEAGLTQPQIEQAQGDMPEAGVRPLFRRPVPYSRGTQHARLEQMFGGN